MATEQEYQNLYDRIAALRDTVTNRLASDLVSNPQLADVLTKQIDDMLQLAVGADAKAPPPPDKGLAKLAGIGPQAAKDFGQARIPQGVEAYDETITSERIIAVGDVYYIYQHEKINIDLLICSQHIFILCTGTGCYYQCQRGRAYREDSIF